MLKSAAIVLLGALHALSLYGYGRYFQKLDGPVRVMPWSFSIVLGLGCWIFIGGVLNLSGLAYPWALNAVVIAGLGLSVLACLRAPRGGPAESGRNRPRIAALAPSLIVVVVAGLFVSATLTPSAAFNAADDFHKYMTYPLRMLQSGTLAGSPLSSLGATTLGGQSFLQGFVLIYGPPEYINGFDLLFCFVLCMLLLLDFGLKLGAPPAIILLAVLSVMFINPQYVNVASLYSGSAFLLALVLFTFTRARMAGGDRRSDTFTGVVVALCYSSLILLKTTYWPFIAFHFVFLVVSIGVATRDVRRLVRVSLTVALASALFISPWVLLYVPKYLTAVQAALAPAASLPTLASTYGQPIEIAEPARHVVNILSPAPLFHGASFAAYTFAACLAAYYGAFVWIGTRTWNAVPRESRAVFAGTCAAVLAAYPVYIYAAGLHLPGDGPWTWLRYFCPILIGTVPAMLLMAGHYAKDNGILANRPGLAPALLSLPALVMLWTFSPSLSGRIHQAYHYGSILAFPSLARSQDYLFRNRQVLSGPVRRDVENMQHRVPPGERIVAWIATPQHLDYARNRILDVDSAGLASLGTTFPRALAYDDIRRYFGNLQVKYVLWEYGPGAEQAPDILQFATASSAYDRRQGINSLYFSKMLEVISRHRRSANVIHDDGRTVLIRLDG